MNSAIKILNRDHFDKFNSELNISDKLLIISPFIKENITDHILKIIPGNKIRLITRYNTLDFYSGVSDLNAIKMLFKASTEIRGVYRLHSKLYIFDERSAIITSANFTKAGMISNMEFGLLVNDKKIVSECIRHFNDLWEKAGDSVDEKMIIKWQKKIDEAIKHKKKIKNPFGLGDEGNDCFDENEVNNELKSIRKKTGIKRVKRQQNLAKRYFIKYIGATNGRKPLTHSIKKEIQESECDKKVYYSYHPHQISDGDVIYFGRMTENPADYAIIGKGIGIKHIRSRDIVSASEKRVKKWWWKNNYQYFNLVHSCEFINGKLENCVLLVNDIIAKFEHNTLVTTRERWDNGERDIVVTRSLMQKQFVEITPEVAKWLDKQLDKEMQLSGKIVK